MSRARSEAHATVPSLARLVAEPALIDWIVLAYLAVELLSVWAGKPGPARDHFLGYLGSIMVGYGGAVAAYRALTPAGPVWQRLYRLLPLVAACSVYFRLRDIFPIVNAREYDAALHAVDVSIFGTDLSVWIEPFSSAAVIDWFSFFYWLYFPMCLIGIFWAIFLSGDPIRRSRFAVATVLAFLAGHVIYTMIPGLGPWHHLAGSYDAPLSGGWFFQANWNTYQRGAGHDIFPSLHTAVTVLICLFLRSERKASRALRILYWPVLFVSTNIVIATIVLRWHYFIDLVAGTLLAVFCHIMSRRALALYEERRNRAGVTPGYW